MSYNCEILADSLSPQGDRLTTMKITFPRIMLAEFNTHRMFSRNSASSRAIPFKKMVQMVEENPFIPMAWQKSHSGMQGAEYFTGIEAAHAYLNEDWLLAKDEAVYAAKRLNDNGLTKQLCNRLLEPFMWHTVIVTSSSWENFFKLRCPDILHQANGRYYRSLKDWNNVDKEIQWTGLTCLHPENKSQAEIHIQAIAEMMWDAYNESTPKQLQAGEWHIPYVNNINLSETQKWLGEDSYKIKIATARCARISYTTLGDNPKIDYEADIKLHDMLAESGHWSPFEHCARAMDDTEHSTYCRYDNGASIDGWCNNFRGFIQYRHLIENNNENISH